MERLRRAIILRIFKKRKRKRIRKRRRIKKRRKVRNISKTRRKSRTYLKSFKSLCFHRINKNKRVKLKKN